MSDGVHEGLQLFVGSLQVFRALGDDLLEVGGVMLQFGLRFPESLFGLFALDKIGGLAGQQVHQAQVAFGKVMGLGAVCRDDPQNLAGAAHQAGGLHAPDSRFEQHGHLQLFGRKKNMIVTEGGKNIYPEDIETVFDGLPVKEYAVFASNYVWPKKELGKEELTLALRLEQNQKIDGQLLEDVSTRNRKLPDFKRVSGYLVWEKDFPRTASMKIKRQLLAEELGKAVERRAVVQL